MKTPIINMLLSRAKKNNVSFHMPGHKGRSGFMSKDVLVSDITELDGTDNLLCPSGVIKESQAQAAKVMYARELNYTVGGSSIGVEAAILSAVRPGEKILMARDFHVSAINAVAIADAKPVFIYPKKSEEYIPSVVTYSDVKRAVSENPDAKAIYLTYPNYYGLCCDIEKISHMAHSVGMKLIVDGAHSAAFGFSDLLPCSCGEANADVWTVSLHKTLNAPNQCACVCIGENSSVTDVKSYINMLQTTSPSYPMLASSEYCIDYMEKNGEQKLAEAILMVESFILKVEALGGYKCVTADIPEYAGAYDRDILKVIIDVTDRGVTGFNVAKSLANKGVEVEGADERNIILICTAHNTKEDYLKMLDALMNIFGTNYNVAQNSTKIKYFDSMDSYNDIRKIMFGAKKKVSFVESIGKVCAAAIGAYPPGVPLILPGEKITINILEQITGLQNAGYDIFGTDGKSITVSEEL